MADNKPDAGDEGPAEPVESGHDQLPGRVVSGPGVPTPNFFTSAAPVTDFYKQLRGGPGSIWPNLASVGKILPAVSMPAVPVMAPGILRSLTASTHSLASIHPELTAFTTTFKAPAFVWPDYAGAFAAMFERLRETLPPNWSEEIDESEAISVIGTDGIPLVWVPRTEIVAAVLAASDRNARLQLLIIHQAQIVDDCREVLAGITEESLSGKVPLAIKAVEALAAGHFEAAQALAVVVAESAIAPAISDKYQTVKKQVLFDPELIPYSLLRLRAALLPIGGFYTDWSPKSPHPMPEALSRHVSVHHAAVVHYTNENAVLAVLLVTSVLRALQELQEIAAASDDEAA